MNLQLWLYKTTHLIPAPLSLNNSKIILFLVIFQEKDRSHYPPPDRLHIYGIMIAKNYTLSVLTAAIVRRPVIRVLIARSIEVTASMKYNSRACLKNAFWHMYPKGMICFTVCTLNGMIWRMLPEFRRCTQRAWYSGLHWLNLGNILRKVGSADAGNDFSNTL